MIASLQELYHWLSDVYGGRWQWYRNTRCKYVTLKIDTRSGAYQILDRDGIEITFEELERQFSSSREFEIDGHKFTVARNITGTGGYVVAETSPNPGFVCVIHDMVYSSGASL